MMIERFEYEGDWWFPESPERKVKGKLKFDPKEGASLYLVGSKEDLATIVGISKPEIILGFSTDGKKITLYDSLLSKSSVHVPGMIEQWFYVTYVFVGTHFHKAEDIKFKSANIRFSYLDDWVDVSGFKIGLLKKGGYSIRYKLPKDFRAKISNDLKVNISFGAKYPALYGVQKEVYAKQEAWIRIIPSEVKTLEYFLLAIHHIQDFLTLVISEPVYPLYIKADIESEELAVSFVNIFYRLPRIADISRTLYPQEMLFAFEDISKQFGFLLRNWFRKRELLSSVSDLYLGVLYAGEIYLNNEFLNLVQAIESYHRRTMKNYELPEAEHKKRVAEILNAVSSEHRRWLKEELKYSNEPNLRKRLRGILESSQMVSDELITNKKLFINKIVDTRNYLTHFDPILEEKAAKNEELFKFTLKLKILLQFCLLKEIGLSFELIKKSIFDLIQRKYGTLDSKV